MWIELVKSACRLFLLLQQRRAMLLRGAKVRFSTKHQVAIRHVDD